MNPIELILSKLSDVRKVGSGWSAKCPTHDDHKASLSINVGDGGHVLLKCHAGCKTEDVCQGMRLTLRDLFPRNRKKNGEGQIVKTYDYCDAYGKQLYQVVRYEPKDFRQRRPDGKGGWIWNLKSTPRVLYRLRELLAAQSDEWVFVVEGEKDADRLARLGLVATCNAGGAGKWKTLADDTALENRKVAIICDKDAAGRKHAADVASRSNGRAQELRVLELPGDGKDVSDWLDAGGTRDKLIELADLAPPAEFTGTAADQPNILIDTDEYRVVNEAIEALKADPNLYQRGGMLVRVMRERNTNDGVSRTQGSVTIQMVPTANLRERMTRYATFSCMNGKKEEKPCHPKQWIVRAVEARGTWEGIRALCGVADAPVLRRDGSIWQSPGYDAETGVLFSQAFAGAFPVIDGDVCLDRARAAVERLLDVVADFPFEAEEHKSAWLAALLTPLARHAFDGPAPLFLIDANVRGAGKSLLAQTIAHIVLGREMPVSSYAHDSDELRKKLTAIALAGDQMVLFDNLNGVFGNDTLDRALTSSRWKDRILGRSEEVDLPLLPAWFATGNNVQVGADTLRRIIHIRLDCLNERPEGRSGFRHPNLIKHIDQNRSQLLMDGLTILSGYLRTERTPYSLEPFGSFEGWSDVVRRAVVWVGLPDPCLTRGKLSESADTSAEAFANLIHALTDYQPASSGFTVAGLLGQLYPCSDEQNSFDPVTANLRVAIEEFANSPTGESPKPKVVGNRLRRFRRRVVNGLYLDENPQRTKRGRVWMLHRTE
ncbi:MAG: hypothetical protein ACPGXK_13090 [Phycisphaerae bacterium]